MAEPAPLPELPERVEADALRDLDDEALNAIVSGAREAERATAAAMAPYTQQLRELAARINEVATECRRRERAAHTQQRRAVREAAASGALTSFGEALAAPDSSVSDATSLAEVVLYLRTGGEVRLGFPGRPGPTSFTDGRQIRTATTWGEARAAYADGWDLGTPQLAGVRIHLVGTKVERVCGADDVVIGEAPAE